MSFFLEPTIGRARLGSLFGGARARAPALVEHQMESADFLLARSPLCLISIPTNQISHANNLLTL